MSNTLTEQDIKAIGKEFSSVAEKIVKNITQMETTGAIELMNVDEISERLKLEKQSVYSLIKNEDIKSVKIGKQIYVKTSDFNEYINSKYSNQI